MVHFIRKVSGKCKYIMMTLDLDFWLMLCSSEDFSFRNVYFIMLVGTKQLYTQTRIKKFRIETPFLDENVKSKEKCQNFKICKPISLSVFKLFFKMFLSFLYFGD